MGAHRRRRSLAKNQVRHRDDQRRAPARRCVRRNMPAANKRQPLRTARAKNAEERGRRLTVQPLATMPDATRRAIRGVFTDIDDTLSTHGRIGAASYAAMERLHEAGRLVIPITGRPAGWCDHIARMWPIDAVVGENGAFYMHHDDAARKLVRRFALDETTRRANRDRLATIGKRILAEVPGCALASDQRYRESDLAIDYCEDVAPLPRAAV